MTNTRWEYKSFKLAAKGGKLNSERFEQLLNGLGQEGWELVSVFDTSRGFGDTRDVVAAFKRERDL